MAEGEGRREGGRTDGQEFKRETVRVHLPSDLEADRVTNSGERGREGRRESVTAATATRIEKTLVS